MLLTYANIAADAEYGVAQSKGAATVNTVEAIASYSIHQSGELKATVLGYLLRCAEQQTGRTRHAKTREATYK